MWMILKYIFHFPSEHTSSTISIIESCFKDVFSKLVANKLSANSKQNRIFSFNSRNINSQVIYINLDSDIISLSYSAKNLDSDIIFPSYSAKNLDSDIISPRYSSKNLGVLFQSDMSLDNHISSIIKSYLAQLRDFRRIRPLTLKTSAITLANSFTHSCLDFCNSLFYGLPHYSIHHHKRFKIQLLALSLVVSVHHTALGFLNLCIGYLLTTVLILRFVASLIVRCFYMNLVVQVICSAFDKILTLFVLPLLAHCYYHTSIKNHMVFIHFHMLHLISGITYLITFLLHQPKCRLEKI